MEVYPYNLVGGDWNMAFIFSYIGNVIIPIDYKLYFRGVETTNRMVLWNMNPYISPTKIIQFFFGV